MNDWEAVREWGEMCKIVRKKKGMKQTELAALVGVHGDHVSRREVGTNVPRPETKKLIQDALGIEIKVLYRLKEQAPGSS